MWGAIEFSVSGRTHFTPVSPCFWLIKSVSLSRWPNQLHKALGRELRFSFWGILQDKTLEETNTLCFSQARMQSTYCTWGGDRELLTKTQEAYHNSTIPYCEWEECVFETDAFMCHREHSVNAKYGRYWRYVTRCLAIPIHKWISLLSQFFLKTWSHVGEMYWICFTKL